MPSSKTRRLDTLRARIAAELQGEIDAQVEAAVAEIEDAERGQRIRELRQARRLTEHALWERMCEIGGPKKDGSPFISFRMVQRYGQGAGISWKATRVLAQALETTEDYILRGDGERRQPRPARQIDTDLAERLAAIEERLGDTITRREPGPADGLGIGRIDERLDRIEAELQALREQRAEILQTVRDEIRAAIEEPLGVQTEILARIEGSIELADDASTRADDAASRLAAAVQQATKALRAAPRETAARAAKPAAPRTHRASRQGPQ
jgi:transcriptional regulator with XRE-family HTH domain